MTKEKGKAPAKGSATGLANKCNFIGTENQCIVNIANNIESVGKLDFVGLQEASNFKELIKKCNNLKQMKYIHHKVVEADMVSFYNPKLFDLKSIKVGRLTGKDVKDGRPYQIIYLRHKTNNKIFMFINVHCPHETQSKAKYTTDQLQIDLLKDINNQFINDAFNNNNLDIQFEKSKYKIKINDN